MGLKSNFLEKVLARIGRLDAQGLQNILQRLAEERDFLETLFNILTDGIVVVDLDGRIAYLNEAGRRFLGVAEVPEGQPVTRYLPQVAALLKEKPVSEIQTGEFQADYPRHRYLRVHAAPIQAEGGAASGTVLILHDATEAREKAFAAIESERSHALRLLAASVAHEVGNPLHALHIHLQLMERELKKLRRESSLENSRSKPRRENAGGGENSPGQPLEKLDQYLAVAKGEISRLDYIITEFLQALRPAPLQLQHSSLNDVVIDTLSLLRPELENRGIGIEEKLWRNLPLTSFDPAQIKQVLVNLVKNAMQAMTRGGVLRLETGASSDGIWVSVQDTGVGISEEQLRRIFEPFFTTKREGTGLGLMIVKRIVRAHGGRVDVQTNLGEGTVFRVWLPPDSPHPRLLEEKLDNG